MPQQLMCQQLINLRAKQCTAHLSNIGIPLPQRQRKDEKNFNLILMNVTKYTIQGHS